MSAAVAGVSWNHATSDTDKFHMGSHSKGRSQRWGHKAQLAVILVSGWRVHCKSSIRGRLLGRSRQSACSLK